MTRFEEFEKDFENVGMLQGMKCTKITLLFESEDGDHAEIGIERDGVAHTTHGTDQGEEE